MSGQTVFDPYLSWLGIRDPQRPPNHYRLLGLELFEADAGIIAAAADRQMSHVRTYQAGGQSDSSQKLLNELMAAKLCLLKPDRKADYDQKIIAQLAAASPAANGFSGNDANPMADAFAHPAMAEDSQVSAFGTTGSYVVPSLPKPKVPQKNSYAMWGVFGGLAVLAAVLIAVLINNNSGATDPPSPQAKGTEQTKGTDQAKGTGQTKPKEMNSSPGPTTITNSKPKKSTNEKPGNDPKEKPAPDTPDPNNSIAKPADDPDNIKKTDPPKKDPPNNDAAKPGLDSDLPANKNPKKIQPVPIIKPKPKKRPQIALNVPKNEKNGNPPLDKEEARKPVPTLNELTESRKKIRTSYKSEFGLKNVPDLKLSFVKKLVTLGKESTDDSTAMYAFFDEARALAADLGDVILAVSISEQIADNFQVEANKEIAMALQLARNADDLKPITHAYNYVYTAEALDYSLQEDNVELAESFLTTAKFFNSHSLPLFRPAGDNVLKNYTKELSELRNDLAKYSRHRETLNNNADDAEANTEWGKYLCFARGRFDEGLPFLAKGNDEVLKTLATEEIDDKFNPSKYAEIWWQMVDKVSPEFRSEVRLHAAVLYARALPNLRSLAKTNAEARLAELDKDKSFQFSNRNLQEIYKMILTQNSYTVKWINPNSTESVRFNASGTVDGLTYGVNRWEFSNAFGTIMCMHGKYGGPSEIKRWKTELDYEKPTGHFTTVNVSLKSRITLNANFPNTKAIVTGIGILESGN